MRKLVLYTQRGYTDEQIRGYLVALAEHGFYPDPTQPAGVVAPFAPAVKEIVPLRSIYVENGRGYTLTRTWLEAGAILAALPKDMETAEAIIQFKDGAGIKFQFDLAQLTQPGAALAVFHDFVLYRAGKCPSWADPVEYGRMMDEFEATEPGSTFKFATLAERYDIG